MFHDGQAAAPASVVTHLDAGKRGRIKCFDIHSNADTDLTPYFPMVCIGRDIPMGHDFIDAVYVSSAGHIVIVESCLTSEADGAARILDCINELRTWNYDRLDNIASDYFYETEGQAALISDVMAREGHIKFSDIGRFKSSVNNSLFEASFLTVLVGTNINMVASQVAEYIDSADDLSVIVASAELANDEPSMTRKTRRTIIEEFADNGGYDEDEVSGFISELESIDGIVVGTLQSSVTVEFSPADGYSYPLLTFSAPTGHADIFIIPGKIEDDLKRHAIFPFEANEFLKFFQGYVDMSRCRKPPYEARNAFYYANVSLVLNEKEKFISAVKQFVNSISTPVAE